MSTPGTIAARAITYSTLTPALIDIADTDGCVGVGWTSNIFIRSTNGHTL